MDTLENDIYSLRTDYVMSPIVTPEVAKVQGTVHNIKTLSDDDQFKMYQTCHWIVILQHVCGMLGFFKMLKIEMVLSETIL